MIDIRLIRENRGLVKENIKKKFQDAKLPMVDEVRELDENWRKLKTESDGLRAERNTISKQIKINEIMLQIPNIISDDTPEGKDASENKEIKRGGKIPKFKFEPKNHV